MRENQGCFLSQQDFLDHLQYDVFHARKVESLDCELSAVLDVDSEVHFISIIVLHTQH